MSGIAGKSKMLLWIFAAAASIILATTYIKPHPNVETKTVIYTSTRNISALASAPDNSLWIGTRGGILHRIPDGSFRKYTCMDGLPSNEVVNITCDGKTVKAVFPAASASLQDGHWLTRKSTSPASTEYNQQTAYTIWNGQPCRATLTDLQIQVDHKWLPLPFPPSTGSHISALLPRSGKLWAAVFGDGIWVYDGKSWLRPNIGIPSDVCEITCMLNVCNVVWIGTRNDGLWSYESGVWKQHLQPDEPFNHNCQFMHSYRGELYISTLEDGLVVKATDGWLRYPAGTISSNAPRQMAVFKDCLYLRNGDGKIDRFDGHMWTRNVCNNLPRKQASSLASDERYLYVGQWGGWSRFDGKSWKHSFEHSELQRYPVTALMPAGRTLWIGTQGCTAGSINSKTDQLKLYNESDGLPDDWIRAIGKSGDSLLVGTFIGGLAVYNGSKWTVPPELANAEVTAIEPCEKGAFIATRNRVWFRDNDGNIKPVRQEDGFRNKEIQALCLTRQGLWIGTRTGLYLITNPY